MHLSFCSEYGYARGSALKPKTNKRFHALRHFGDSQVLSLGLVPNIKGSSSLDSTARARGEGWILLAGVIKGGGKAKKKTKKLASHFSGGADFFFLFFWLGCLPYPSILLREQFTASRGGWTLLAGGIRGGGGGGKAKKKLASHSQHRIQ